VRYEDLRANTFESVRRSSDGWSDVSEAHLRGVVEQLSFEALPESARARASSRVQRHRPWRDNLTSEEQAAIHDILGDALARLGYQTLRAQTESRRAGPNHVTEYGARDLAVVIPTRDRWGILRRTLDALRRQTSLGRDDRRRRRHRSKVPDLPGVNVVVKEHGGRGRSQRRSRATKRSIVLFLGDDMIPEPIS